MALLLIGMVSVLLRNALFLFGPPEFRDEVRSRAPELRDAAAELRAAAEKEAAEIAAESDDMGIEMLAADGADSAGARRDRRDEETT